MTPEMILAVRLQEPASDVAPPMSWATALETVYLTRYTGPLIVNFAEGQPKGIELPLRAAWKIQNPR